MRSLYNSTDKFQGFFNSLLGIAGIDFERRFHVSRHKLSLWETSQAKIDEWIMDEVIPMIGNHFPAEWTPAKRLMPGRHFSPLGV